MATANDQKAPPRFAGTSQNRSLARGLELLRAFKPGADLLGNSELSERTGIAKATVSRLTQTLVTSGFLEYDQEARAYRLAAPVLSLGHAMQSASRILQIAKPLMRHASINARVNVGLACADRTEMIYLESIRYNRKASLRTIAAGQRVPIELTSLGRAYLATLPDDVRARLLAGIRPSYRASTWKTIAAQIESAHQSVTENDFCLASWQPNVVAFASPLRLPGSADLVLNMSTQSDLEAALLDSVLPRKLRDLKRLIVATFEQLPYAR